MADSGTRSDDRPGEAVEVPYTLFDAAYAALITDVLENGRIKPSRQEGSETISASGKQIRVGVGRRMAPTPDTAGTVCVRDPPVLHSKRIAFGMVAEELAWFLRGGTNALDLAARSCNIWDDDAEKARARGFNYPPGELGPIYGYQWRKRPDGDQIERAINALVDNFSDRGIVVDSWDVERIGEMVLRPCHYSFQFVATPIAAELSSAILGGFDPRGYDFIQVDCVVTMRSTDVGLGLPFNVVSYALLTILCALEAERRYNARKVGRRFYTFGDVVVNMGDCHIYASHRPELAKLAGAVGGSAISHGHSVFGLTVPTRARSGEGMKSDDIVDIFAADTAAKRRNLWSPAIRAPGANFPATWRPPRIPLKLHT